MTATDILRRLLDERGVEWRVGDYPTTCTVWESDGIVWHGLWRDGCIELIAWQVTPEQAIDATLGRGTCRIGRGISGLMHVTTGHCSECGAEVVKPARYCSNCGRKVEP